MTAMNLLIQTRKENGIPFEMMNIKDLHFIQTCASCPEQYDVFDVKGSQVGYVRLRWGHLTCEYPDCGGEVVYETNFDDGWQGCFANEDDRRLFLEDIANAIHRHIVKTEDCPVKKVLCIDNFDNGAFGSWRAGLCYDVVRYCEKNKEWHIKDLHGKVGIVDSDKFDEYFERVAD
jgi:hypothetical protein